MAKPYSMDLRERVLADVDAGIKIAKVARMYRVTRPSIYSWLALRDETGDLKPRPRPAPTSKLDEYREEIEQVVKAQPDVTLMALKLQLELPVSLGTVWNALDKWDLSFKKKPVCS